MNREELRQATLSPAKRTNVSFEPGLVETILDNVASKPGSLPLLQFALREMWHSQEKRTITRASYESVGGIQGSLARRAEAIYAGSTDNGASVEMEDRFRRLFTRLVMLGGGQEDTRRVVDRKEIGEDLWLLAQRLADEDNRLVVTNTLGPRETVELTHEALIQHWPRLLSWLDGDRAFQLWLRQIRLCVDLWEAKSEDEAPLLLGSMLAEAKNWMNSRHDDLNPLERRYIQASQECEARLQDERAFLMAAMSSLGLSDLSDRNGIDLARIRKLRDFISLIPMPRFVGWQAIVASFGETLGLGPKLLSTEMLAVEPSHRDETDWDKKAQAIVQTDDKLYVVLASAGDREQAYSNAEGSLFGRFFAEALEGHAADPRGLVTIEQVFQYVTKRLATSFANRRMIQRPMLHVLGLSTHEFSLTATSQEQLPTMGKRYAILAASDSYHDSRLANLPGTEVIMQRAAKLLAELGNFNVSMFLGEQMTRANVIKGIRDVMAKGGPEDTLLFYFSGHGGFASDDHESMALFLTDSGPEMALSTIDLRELGNGTKNSSVGTVIMVLDASYAAAAVRYFQ